MTAPVTADDDATAAVGAFTTSRSWSATFRGRRRSTATCSGAAVVRRDGARSVWLDLGKGAFLALETTAEPETRARPARASGRGSTCSRSPSAATSAAPGSGGWRRPRSRSTTARRTRSTCGTPKGTGLASHIGQTRRSAELASVTFLTDGGRGESLRVACDDGASVFEVARAAGVAITTACVGKATCGLCRVKIVGGEDVLTPLNTAERKHLGNVYFINKLRLSCQARVSGDVVVEIPGPARALPR